MKSVTVKIRIASAKETASPVSSTQDGIGRIIIATGTTSLLIISLDTFGKIEMGNETHVWFVYAHAESDRGDDDNRLVVLKSMLVLGSHL